jgi:hypothetical protein
MYDCEKKLLGKKVLRVFMNEDYLKFETDKGNVVYKVDGDCCSTSYFYDFFGVEHLINNGPIVEVKEVELHPSDIVDEDGSQKDKKNSDSSIAVYGYQLTTEHKDLGLVTSVFSFRNYSNGYYGGSLEEESDDRQVMPEIASDILETVENPIKE